LPVIIMPVRGVAVKLNVVMNRVLSGAKGSIVLKTGQGLGMDRSPPIEAAKYE
jgi:hypothetical protein